MLRRHVRFITRCRYYFALLMLMPRHAAAAPYHATIACLLQSHAASDIKMRAAAAMFKIR